MVENSASAFIDAPTTSLKEMARRRMAEVAAPDGKPKKSRESTIGMPSMSYLKMGSSGKRIFRPANFNAQSRMNAKVPNKAVPAITTVLE